MALDGIAAALNLPMLFAGEFASAKGRRVIDACLQVPMQRHSASSLIEPAFEAADRSGQTVYDCTYLVLAVMLNCRMMSADEKFFQAISRTRIDQYITWISAEGLEVRSTGFSRNRDRSNI